MFFKQYLLHSSFKSVFLLFFAVSFCGYLHAQKPTISYITIDEFPLSNKEQSIRPYDIETDSSGFVYTAGPTGLYRFDGESIVRLNTGNIGFRDLYRDHNNRLWTRSLNQGLFLVDFDTIRPYGYNDSLKSIWAKKWLACYFDESGTLYIGTIGYGWFSISADGEFHQYKFQDDGIYGFVITELSDGTLIHWLQAKKTDPQSAISVYYQAHNEPIKKVAECYDKQFGHQSSLVQYSNGNWALATGNHEVVVGNADSLIFQKQYPHQITGLFKDSHKNLWIATFRQGVYKTVGEKLMETAHLMPEFNAAVVAEDANGGLWIKSEQRQLVYIPNVDMLRYSHETGQMRSNLVSGLRTDFEWVYVHTLEGMTALRSDSAQQIRPPTSGIPTRKQVTYNNIPTASCGDPFGLRYFTGNSKMIGVWDGIKWQLSPIVTKQIQQERLIALRVVDTNQLIGITKTQLVFFDDGKVTNSVAKTAEMSNMRSFDVDHYNNVWVGTSEGLWVWNHQHFVRPNVPEGHQLITSTVDHIHQLRYSTFVHLANQDIYVLNEEAVYKLTDENGEPLYLVNGFVSKQLEYWGCGTKNKSVYQIKLEGDSCLVRSYRFDDYAFQFDYTSKQPLAIIDSNICIGNSGGIFITPINKLIEQGAIPQPYIKKVLANYKPMLLDEHYELAYHQNTIQLEFGAISFRFQEPEFRYRLLGMDSIWHSPVYNALQYTNLNPGEYVFELQARMGMEEWSPVKSVSLHIETPIWKTWWFQTVMYSLILIFLGVIAYIWYRVQRKRTALEIDMLKAEQKALKAQMNPHFVYNALNSAQRFLLEGNTSNYNFFMSQLADFIRSGLEQSQLTFIPLVREIGFLENYLKIETQRFPDRFSYAFHVSDDLNEVSDIVELPPFMIQPLCENIIKHAYVDTQVKIDISFKQEGNTLTVSVQDNGVGYKGNGEKSGKHESMGLSILKTRIALLRKQGFEASYSIDYLHTGSEKGTIVILKLPIT